MAENCGFSTTHIHDIVDPSVAVFTVIREGRFAWSVYRYRWADAGRVAGPFWWRSTAARVAVLVETAYIDGQLARAAVPMLLDVLELDAGVPVG